MTTLGGSKEVSYFKAHETPMHEGILIFVLRDRCIQATLQTKMANPYLMGSSNYGEATIAATVEKLILWICTDIVVCNNSSTGLVATAASQSMRAFYDLVCSRILLKRSSMKSSASINE
jgi:hypothetical protein